MFVFMEPNHFMGTNVILLILKIIFLIMVLFFGLGSFHIFFSYYITLNAHVKNVQTALGSFAECKRIVCEFVPSDTY